MEAYLMPESFKLILNIKGENFAILIEVTANF